MKIKYTIWGVLAGTAGLILTSCEEKGLLVSSNDTAYLRFANDMTKDTTTVSFKMYNEGEDAEIPIEVSVYGQMQNEDLHFNVSADAERTTLPANLYVLPADCKIRKGLLTDTIYVTLKNDPILKTETKVLALQVVEIIVFIFFDYLCFKLLLDSPLYNYFLLISIIPPFSIN